MPNGQKGLGHYVSFPSILPCFALSFVLNYVLTTLTRGGLMEIQQAELQQFKPLKPYMEQSRRTSMFHYKYLKKRGQFMPGHQLWIAEAS
ncbi:hypothetical protein HYS47_00240 [Candidatus Woesearchaeota archaeon]|nr:hypothetical protein [Candidatus Woesearchaeota archaeon]